MDPLTHALVGVGVASLTGDEFSLTNPLHLGAVLGSLAPDFDAVLQLYGDIPYLTNHRGFTHSIPGVFIISAVLAGILWLLTGSHPAMIFIWTLLGAMSHIILDLFNSYGAKIFWPFSQKNYTLNLLVLADPVIIFIFIGVILWPGMPSAVAKTAFWLALFYLAVRLYMRRKVYRILWQKYKDAGAKKIVVMPAMVSLWNWSFLVDTDESYIVGEMRCFSVTLGIKKVLVKSQEKDDLIAKALQSKAGKFFQNFTPHFHIYHCVEEGKHVVRFCDLRYFLNDDFLHHATVVFDEGNNMIDAVIQPYSKKRKIRIMG